MSRRDECKCGHSRESHHKKSEACIVLYGCNCTKYQDAYAAPQQAQLQQPPPFKHNPCTCNGCKWNLEK